MVHSTRAQVCDEEVAGWIDDGTLERHEAGSDELRAPILTINYHELYGSRMPTPSSGGRAPSVFDYGWYAFLTEAEPVTEVVLLRHAQQALVSTGSDRFDEAVDPPLSVLGERQAGLAGQRFAAERVDAVYTSGLRRAHATGVEVARHHGLEPAAVADLREVELFRDLAPGQSVEDAIGRRLLMGVRERMMVERRWDVYPLSEPSAEFRKRVVNAIEGIAAMHDGERVVVACHGGVINAYLAHHLGIARDMFFRPAHTSVSVVRVGHHGVRALHLLGDVHHLTAGGAGCVTY
jgi:probable phosphoglycerate mutase